MESVEEQVDLLFPSMCDTFHEDEYRKVPAISQSHLKLILRSPLHFYNTITTPREPTDAQKLGLAVHCALLGTHGPVQLAVRPEEMSPYSREGKAWKAEQAAQGKIVVTQEDIQRAEEMRRSLNQDPEIAAALSGQKEVSCFAELKTDEGELVQCKARIDSLPLRSDTVVDLKTCRSGSLHTITSDIASYQYAFQAVHYLKMYEAARKQTDLPRDKFLFIFVESEPPYATRKVMLSDRWMMLAESSWLEAMRRLTECRRTGEWPGYGREIYVVNPPPRDDMRYVEAIME